MFTVASNLTNSMEQDPSWEANSCSASQQIPLSTSNPKIHYRVHSSTQLVHILSQMHPIHNLPPYLPKIPAKIMSFHLRLCLPNSLSFRFSAPKLCKRIFLSPMRARSPTHLVLLVYGLQIAYINIAIQRQRQTDICHPDSFVAFHVTGNETEKRCILPQVTKLG
jgi:hypothetical protein